MNDGGVARSAGFGSDPVLAAYARHFGIALHGDPRACLRAVLRSFARLPYENLSKIVRHAETGSLAAARRHPSRVVSDHAALGAGGTCFSLTATLCHLVRALGFEAEPILADRRYGSDTHCALLVWIDARPHLVDPGYLLVEPVPLGSAAQTQIETSFHTVRLVPHASPGKVDLFTLQGGAAQHRLTLKVEPVDERTFVRAWDASFSWEMMCYPLLNAVVGDTHVYVRAGHWQQRSRTGVQRIELAPEEWTRAIAGAFALDAKLVERALRVLSDRGGMAGAVEGRDGGS